jgi:prepilin-type N-terminal cleavage/methylation domain-containing protein
MSQKHKHASGFTMIELMISLAVFLVIAGAVLGGIGAWQSHYRDIQIRNSLQGRMRAALELMTQEIGQAGLVASGADQKELAGPLAKLTSNISAGAGISTVTVDSVGGICDGEYLQFGSYGSNSTCGTTNNWEKLQVQVVSNSPPTIKANFSQKHCSWESIYARGVYPEGVVASASNASQLVIFGDINSNSQQMEFVKYSCPSGTSTSLTRQAFDLSGNAITPAQPLIDNVTDCKFLISDTNYQPYIPVSDAIQLVSLDPFLHPEGYQVTMVPIVGITVTAKSEKKDSSGSYVTVQEQYLNLQPRNILASYIELGYAAPQGTGSVNPNELQILPNTFNSFTTSNFTGNCTSVP